MTAAALLGAGFGLGVVLIVTGWLRIPVPLAIALDELHRAQPGARISDATSPSATARLFGQSWLGTSLARRVLAQAGADLRITGTSPAEHLAQRVLCALV